MRLFVLLTLVLVFSPIASAQEKSAPSKEASKEQTKAEKKTEEETPITKWLAEESAVVKALDNKGKETYFIIRNKYGIIRAIRIVKRDIGKAVQACGQENPDMQDKMNVRFKDWSNAVDPILNTADAFVAQEIKAQKVVEVSTFKDMLELNDDAFEYQEGLMDKQPVSTKEACEKLLISMDRTEEDMLRLMQDILLPESVIRERADKMDKAKKEQEANKKKAPENTEEGQKPKE